MGEFAIKQRYPDSWRLDHPDFGDVHGTTYAKGTIKEFQKISEDPLRVKSMVKVEVEGYGTSDFIPLFYHPKPQYWDDEAEGIKAADFNQEGRYFERAWMSFRAGDEVRVLLRDGTPYAVMGFDDAVPRIGEDIFKLEWGLLESKTITSWEIPIYPDISGLVGETIMDLLPGGSHYRYLQASKRRGYGQIDENKQGPDKLDLKLMKEIKPFNISISQWKSEVTKSYTAVAGYDWMDITPPPYPPPGVEFIPTTSYSWNYWANEGTSDYKALLYEWLIPVGSILYGLSILSLLGGGESKETLWAGGYTPWAGFYRNEQFYSISKGFGSNTLFVNIKAGIYTDDLFNRLSSRKKNAKAAYDDSTCSSIVDLEMTLQNWEEDAFNFVLENELNKSLDVANLRIFARPHNRRELQEAGMWPTS